MGLDGLETRADLQRWLEDAIGPILTARVRSPLQMWGGVSPTGVKRAGSGGWSVARGAVGSYTVTFDRTFPDDFYGVLALPNTSGSGTAVCDLSAFSAAGFSITTFASTNGANVDSYWTFAVLR